MKMTKTSAAELQSLQVLYTRLGFIIRRAGIDQISLGALIGADRSTVASVVRPLDYGGLIARRADPNDRRRKQLTLTDAGQDMLRRAEPITHVISDSMRTVLSDDQITALKDILGAFVSAFNDQVRNPLVPDDAADRSPTPAKISKPKAAAKKRSAAETRVR